LELLLLEVDELELELKLDDELDELDEQHITPSAENTSKSKILVF
jgi:hypothetical protein